MVVDEHGAEDSAAFFPFDVSGKDEGRSEQATVGTLTADEGERDDGKMPVAISQRLARRKVAADPGLGRLHCAVSHYGTSQGVGHGQGRNDGEPWTFDLPKD